MKAKLAIRSQEGNSAITRQEGKISNKKTGRQNWQEVWEAKLAIKSQKGKISNYKSGSN